MLLVLVACVDDYGVNQAPPDPLDTAPRVALDPESLVFAPLEMGGEATLPLTVTNVGATTLSVSDVRVTGTSAFTLVDAETAFALAPDESVTVTVRFSPVNPEDVGALEVDSDDPVTPEATAALTGEALVPELRVYPDPLSYGDVPLDCVSTQTMVLANVGLTDLVVSTIVSDSEPFTVDDGDLPLTLAPGEEREVDVGFSPRSDTTYAGTIYVTTNELAGYQAIAADGSGTVATSMEDVFQQGEETYDKTDILLYVDGSNSMADDQQNVAENFGTFVEALAAAELDWQLMVVTDDDGCHNGPIFDLSNINTSDLLDAVRGPSGFYNEAGLTLAYTALADAGLCNAGFQRADARTTLILVSDEAEQSTFPASERVERILEVAPSARIHAIAGDVPDGCATAEPGTGYDEAAALTGGAFLSICDADWGAYFETIAERTASNQTDTFPLSARPNPATIEVTVAGDAAVGWTWDEGQNAVVFDADHWPAPGATVVVAYALDAVCGG